MHDTLEFGLNVQVLDKSIWENEDIDDIRLIVDVDNQEQVKNLADHELHLLNRIRALIAAQLKVDNHLVPLFERVFGNLKSNLGAQIYTIAR